MSTSIGLVFVVNNTAQLEVCTIVKNKIICLGFQ